MPFLIETAQKRLHKKLTRKQGNKRDYPWYESSAIRNGAIQVFVTDDEAARNALQATYYGHRLEFVKADSQDKVPVPAEEAEEQGSGEAKRPQGAQAPHHLNGKVKGSKPRATNVKAPPPPPPEVDNTQSEEEPEEEEPESTDNPEADAA